MAAVRRDSGGVLPARPHSALTPDGRRVRELTSYARRGSRLSPQQQEAWDRHAGQWLVPPVVADAPPLRPQLWFGREAPLVVEIGSGTGEATAELAAARPSYDVLACEVWRPGIADTFRNLERVAATNVRVLEVDAVWSLEHLLEPQSVAELWTFFPDPWPKKRHHRRRLVSPAFAELAASRLVAGGLWRLATDWPDYADQIVEVLGTEPAFEGGPVDRWKDRPRTKYERRALRAGRPVVDFCYRR